MSGHSKWSTIKHKKASTDAKRGKVFSKLARLIAVAAKDGGGDPTSNPRLRDAIDTAKSLNLPKDNIDRAIKRGLGELTGDIIEEVTYEAYGPGGIPLLIEVITDNKNRALGDIKNILSKHGSKMAGEGSVRWMFTLKGVIKIARIASQIPNLDEFELEIIDAGAEDITRENEVVIIYTPVDNLGTIKKILQDKHITPESSGLEWIATEKIEIDEKRRVALEKLFESLAESDDVQEIYSNVSK